jgi:hypothetical protein
VSDVFNEISRTMNNNTNNVVGAATLSTGNVLGTITETGLLLDNFKYEFTDYLVLDYLKLDDSYRTESTSCTVSHNHEFKTPHHLKKLKVGDRVLVAQFGANNVVIGRVVAHA